MSQRDMSKFDWVVERSACSLVKAYETLKLQIQEDVATRNSLRPADESHKFSMAISGNSFAVIREGIPNIHETVIFVLADSAIEVRDKNHRKIFESSTTLSDDGECRLKIEGQERDFWQVRMMALESIFFGNK